MSKQYIANLGDFNLFQDGDLAIVEYHENVNRINQTIYLTANEWDTLHNVIEDYDKSTNTTDSAEHLFYIKELLGFRR